jgi:hypothetical protein
MPPGLGDRAAFAGGLDGEAAADLACECDEVDDEAESCGPTPGGASAAPSTCHLRHQYTIRRAVCL